MNESDNTPNNGDIDNVDASDPTSSENSEGIAKYIILYDGHCVSADFYNAIRYQVEDVIPVLEPGVKYKLKVLCGIEFWCLLTPGECRLAGKCMAQMAIYKQLPLRFAETTHEYPKKYQLI